MESKYIQKVKYSFVKMYTTERSRNMVDTVYKNWGNIPTLLTSSFCKSQTSLRYDTWRVNCDTEFTLVVEDV